jgi:hypothetical protein
MKLNLGFGSHPLEGFINIDVGAQESLTGETQTLPWDLNNGLPKKDLKGQPIDNITFLTSSHCLEHLPDDRVLELLKDCRSKMLPGAVIRLCLPDFRKCARAYLDNDNTFFDNIRAIYNQGLYRIETGSIIDFMSYCAYQPAPGGSNEHVAIWDVDKALKYLEAAGFSDVAESSFSVFSDGDIPLRAQYSFYVTAGVLKL